MILEIINVNFKFVWIVENCVNECVVLCAQRLILGHKQGVISKFSKIIALHSEIIFSARLLLELNGKHVNRWRIWFCNARQVNKPSTLLCVSVDGGDTRKKYFISLVVTTAFPLCVPAFVAWNRNTLTNLFFKPFLNVFITIVNNFLDLWQKAIDATHYSLD